MDLSIRQAAYRSQLTALLPTGRAWATESDPALADFIAALALELARIEQRATELLAEATPYGAYETLPEWEATAGLPDECSASAAGDIQARRMALVARLAGGGAQSKAFYLRLLRVSGQPQAEITKFSPTTCNDDCNAALYSDNDSYCWAVSLHGSGDHRPANCNDDCNSPLQLYQSSAIECVLNKLKPAHTYLIFKYV